MPAARCDATHPRVKRIMSTIVASRVRMADLIAYKRVDDAERNAALEENPTP